MTRDLIDCVKLGVTALVLAGCPGPEVVDGGVDAGGEDPPGPQCTSPTPVKCFDDSMLKLTLFGNDSSGQPIINQDTVEEESTVAGEFTTHLDTRAGGLSPTKSYLYLSFTDVGLVRVDLSDEQALDSMEWDIAARRYDVRINAGVSGPSCTQAARLAPGATFESTTQVPEDTVWRTEAYLTEGEPGDGGVPACDLLSHPSGLGISTAISSYWAYQSCVQMTGNIYVLHLRDGKYVKLQVLAYYSPENQEICDDTGSVPSPTNAGNLRIRWAYVNGPD